MSGGGSMGYGGQQSYMPRVSGGYGGSQGAGYGMYQPNSTLPNPVRQGSMWSPQQMGGDAAPRYPGFDGSLQNMGGGMWTRQMGPSMLPPPNPFANASQPGMTGFEGPSRGSIYGNAPMTGGPSSQSIGPNGPQWGPTMDTGGLGPMGEMDTGGYGGRPGVPFLPQGGGMGNGGGYQPPGYGDAPPATGAAPGSSPVGPSMGWNPQPPTANPTSSTTSLTNNNQWANTFAQQHPELAGQSISPIDYMNFGADGSWNGPVYEGWKTARGYDPNGFTGIKDNAFQVGGVGQIGMLQGWNGHDFGDNQANAMNLLRSQLRVGIPGAGQPASGGGGTPAPGGTGNPTGQMPANLTPNGQTPQLPLGNLGQQGPQFGNVQRAPQYRGGLPFNPYRILG